MNDAQSIRREAPVIIPRPEHNVSRANISKNALKVLYRLKDGGYQAFIVGGGVRDLLLGREPKDFDVATDAHPEQVRKLFRNCRLIGRRFRLAHVHFGREIVEVATFRGAPDDEAHEEGHVATDAEGRILRDNLYGGIDEDVWRRDFTANALYYNIADYSVWDYVGGVEDIRNGVLRLIGDPEERYREDPVRMLRAVRFAAKLGFKLDKATEKPLFELGDLLLDMPPARLYEEILKLFLHGHAVPSFELLRHYDLFRHLFPATDKELSRQDADRFRKLLVAGLENTDKRVAENQPVTPMFLFALFLWGPTSRLAAELRAADQPPMQALMEAADTVTRAQQDHVAVPRRIGIPMREIMTMQIRFRKQHGRKALKVLDHPRFRAAFDFLRLRVEAGEADEETLGFWSELQDLPAQEQKEAVKPGRGRKRRRRRPRKRKPTTA